MDMMTRVWMERDKWLRDFAVQPNALYLGHNEYDYLRSATTCVCLYDSARPVSKVVGMTIYHVDAQSHFSIGVVK